jgi:dTDP-4-dehydrorhamnose reductase
MSYLVTGAEGMLGHDAREALDGREVTALGRAELDITDADAVDAAVAGHDVVINCAAYTRVDDAESDEDAAFAVNATGAGNLARAAAVHGATLVQLSTDYVFDGTATTPYAEDSPRHPMSAYGRTKAEGEHLALELGPARTYIVRTAWLYGAHGANFPKTMLRLARENETVSVVDDQIGQPTWSADVAQQIVLLLDSGATPGVYHATSSGQASWWEFAREIFGASGLDPQRVEPIQAARFPRPAPRPAYSVLGHSRWGEAGLAPIRDWRAALAEAVRIGTLGAA